MSVRLAGMGPQKTQFPPVAGVPEVQQPGTGSEIRDTSLTEAVATLRKRRWVLILAAVLGASYGTYKAYTQPKLFGATATIQVHNGASNAYRVDTSGDYGDDQTTRMNTEMEILRSNALLTMVGREMNLANNPDFWGVKEPIPNQSMDDPPVHAAVVGELQSSIIVALVPRTEMIRITYFSPSAKMAAEIANRIVYDYIQRSYQTPVQSTRRVSEWLSGQLEELKAEVSQSQEQIMALQRKLGTLGYDSSHNQLQSSLEELLTAEKSAKVARITAESRYRMLAAMDPNTIEDSIETTPGTMPGQLTNMRGQLAGDKASYAELTAPGGIGANNPRAKALQAHINTLTKEIDAEQGRMETQAKETYLAAKAAEDKIEQELDARKAEAYQQGDDLVQLTILQREFDQNRTLYDGLKQRLETAKVQAGLEASEVDEVDPALPALGPTIAPPSTIIMSRTVFFLLGGIVIVFILEALDTGLHNIQEIETVMGMPSLAIIPQSKRTSAEQTATMTTAQRNIYVLTQPKSQFTEAFRALRTSLMLATAGKPPRFILFTSAMPSEGKTTIASNLACILFSERRSRSADGRRPAPVEHTPPVWTDRQTWTDDRSGGHLDAGGSSATYSRDTQHGHSSQRSRASVPHRNARFGDNAEADGAVGEELHAHRDRFSSGAVCDRRGGSGQYGGRGGSGGPPRQRGQECDASRTRPSVPLWRAYGRPGAERGGCEVSRLLRVLRIFWIFVREHRRRQLGHTDRCSG